MGLCSSSPSTQKRNKKGKNPPAIPEEFAEDNQVFLDDQAAIDQGYNENYVEQGYEEEQHYDEYGGEPGASPQNDWQDEQRYSPGYSPCPNTFLSPERDMNGYPMDNYSHQTTLHKPGSFLSSNSSNNLTNGTGSSGNRSPRRRPRKRPRANPRDDTIGTLPLLDFNGLLSTEDDVLSDVGKKRPPLPKHLRRSNFKPKRGQVWLWTVNDVRHWIQNLGDAYREYAADFADNAIDGQLLLRMDNNDYHELGVVSALHVKKIQVELDRLVQEHSHKKTHVPKAVLSLRSDMSDSTIKKKKKKKRPKKQAVMAFPSQYSMNPYNPYTPSASVQRWVPTHNPTPSPYRSVNMHPPLPPQVPHPHMTAFGPPHGGMNYRLCTVYE